MPAGTWYPGAVWPGYHVFNQPLVFAQPAVFQGTLTTFYGAVTASGAATLNSTLTVAGLATLNKGLASAPPAVAQPGTVGSGGTVTNSTGYDVMVYASATAGMSAAKLGTFSITGSAVAGQTVPYYLYAGNTITLSYAGTLSWQWLAV